MLWSSEQASQRSLKSWRASSSGDKEEKEVFLQNDSTQDVTCGRGRGDWKVTLLAGKKLSCPGRQGERLEKDAGVPEAGHCVSRQPSHPLIHSFIH